jgi:hypothetical protein
MTHSLFCFQQEVLREECTLTLSFRLNDLAHLAPVAASSIVYLVPAILMMVAGTHTMVIGTLQSKAADTMKMHTSRKNENARPVVARCLKKEHLKDVVPGMQ